MCSTTFNNSNSALAFRPRMEKNKNQLKCFAVNNFFSRSGMIVSSTLVSVLSVLLVAVDRFLYILYGLQYQRYIYPNRSRILIMTTWIFGELLAVFGFGFAPRSPAKISLASPFTFDASTQSTRKQS
jgi:hypothetical protein